MSAGEEKRRGTVTSVLSLDVDRVYYEANSMPPHQKCISPQSAGFCTIPPFFPPSARTRAQARGIHYEKHVQADFEFLYGVQYLRSPWLWWRDRGFNVHHCQPDGLFIQPEFGLVTIVEVKHQHTERAYYQLKNLYEPVLRRIFDVPLHGLPPWQFALVEVCKWYDGMASFPLPVKLIDSLREARPDEFSVHVVNPRL